MKWLLLSASFLFAHLLHSQNLDRVAGQWAGSVEVTGQSLDVSFLFSYTDGELDGTLDIPPQQQFNLPVEFVDSGDDSLTFQFETGTGPAVFHGRWEKDEHRITGTLEQAGMNFPFSIQKRGAGSVDDESNRQNLVISTRAGQISGTLTLTDEPGPLVILISGSGSQDRDAEVAGFRMFRELADQLNEAGFATFRYDDRSVGESQGNPDATLRDLAEDLEDVIGYLTDQYGDRTTKRIFLGHSQGGMVAAIAAREVAVDAILFAASPFVRGDELINSQIRMMSEAQGIDEEIMELNLRFQEKIYEVVRSGGDWDEIEQDLAERLEEQINELPEQQREGLGDMSSFIQSQVERQLAGARTSWFKSFIEFDPKETISQLEIPMKAVFGEKDTQVELELNRAAAEELQQAGLRNLEIVSLESTNHLFQRAETGLPGEYGVLDREFSDDFIEAVISWLNELN